MVQIVENWSEVVGSIREVLAGEGRDRTIVVLLSRVSPIEGVANLLEASVGKEIAIRIPAELAAKLNLTPGAEVAGRVRRADLRSTFAHPRQFVVTPGASSRSDSSS